MDRNLGRANAGRWRKLAGAYLRSAWERLPRLLLNAALLLAVLAVIVVVVATWYARPDFQPGLLGVAAMVGLVGIYPMAYVAYLGVSASAQRDRLQDDFRLLGLVKEEELVATVQKLYQTVYSPVPFVIYISLIVVVSLLIVYAYLLRQAAPIGLPAEIMTLIFYSYLGAYVFSVQELIRRYNTFDLQPQVYSSILARMVVAVVIVFAGAEVIQLSGGQLAANGAAAAPQAWAAVLAFVIGAFPESGLRWFVQQANRVLNNPSTAGVSLPLRNLLGISAWHEARLAQMGIDDAQNLATADLRRMLLTTQFDTQQIVQWIDQAILYVKVGAKLDRYRDARITSLHELRLQLDSLSLDPGLNLSATEVGARKSARERLATVLGAADADELERVGDYTDFPNYAYIAEYYLRTALVARQRASLGMDVLVGALEETNFEQAVDTAQQLLRRNRQDPELYNRLGYAYYQLSLQSRDTETKKELLGEAFQAYSEALRLNNQFARAYYNRSMIYLSRAEYEQAVIDCTNAINIDNSNALAFNNRGLAHMKMGYVDRAVEDLDEALRLDDRLGVAYLNRGVARNALSQFPAAAADFERAYLLGERQAELWISWGIAHIGLEQYQAAVERLSQAVLFEQDSARAYAKRGYAYMQRGRDFYGQAQADLQRAVGRNDELLDAHANLGLLLAQTRRYDEALQHYQKVLAAGRPEFEIVTRYNLAIALMHLGRNAEARREFEAIISKAPAEAIEAQQARMYLAALAPQPATEPSGGTSNGG